MAGCYHCWIYCSLAPGVCFTEYPEHKTKCSIADWRFKHNQPEFYYGTNPGGMSSYRANIRLWIMFLYKHWYIERNKGDGAFFFDPKGAGMLTNALKLLMCIKYEKDNVEQITNEKLKLSKFERDMFLRLMVYTTGKPVKEQVKFVVDNYGENYADDFIQEFFEEEKMSGIGTSFETYLRAMKEKYKNQEERK